MTPISSITFVYIVLKNAFFFLTIFKDQDTIPVLDPSDPLALVNWAIYPPHLPIAMPFVFEVVTLVCVSRLPNKCPKAMLLVILVLSLILVASMVLRILPPLTFPMLESIQKVSLIYASIVPSVLSESLRLPISILAWITVPIGKNVSPLAMFQAIQPLPFIPVSILPHMDSITFSFALAPLTDIGIPMNAFPYSVTLLHTHHPLTIKDLSV